ncbi:MAG: hypothetical protein U0165_05665 [Polyangiaceae bacterium]
MRLLEYLPQLSSRPATIAARAGIVSAAVLVPVGIGVLISRTVDPSKAVASASASASAVESPEGMALSAENVRACRTVEHDARRPDIGRHRGAAQRVCRPGR